MNNERRPYAPPDDQDEVADDFGYDGMPADKELNFNEEPDRDLYDERDLEEDEADFAYDPLDE
jgi:hypothetical protein